MCILPIGGVVLIEPVGTVITWSSPFLLFVLVIIHCLEQTTEDTLGSLVDCPGSLRKTRV